jgi:hypothetical protein
MVTTGAGFTGGVLAHFETFMEGRNGEPGIIVKITLINHDSFLCEKGMRVDYLQYLPGCVMIRGGPEARRTALVVREEHILSAEFIEETVEAETQRFGF